MRIGRKQQPTVEVKHMGKAFVIVLDMGPTGQRLNGLADMAMYQIRNRMQSGAGIPEGAPEGSVMVCASAATAKRAAVQVYRIANNPAMRV